MTVQCPVMGRAASTSYGKGCRCGTCKTWNAQHSRKGRERKGRGNRSFRWPKAVIARRRMEPLLAEADYAFRTDVGYLLEIAALASAEARRVRGLGNSGIEE